MTSGKIFQKIFSVVFALLTLCLGSALVFGAAHPVVWCVFAGGSVLLAWWMKRWIGRTLMDHLYVPLQNVREHLELLKRERDERDTILSGVAEGVLAVDAKERVVLINQAAAAILDRDQKQVLGRPAVEVVPEIEVLHCLESLLQSERAIPAEILIRGREPRHLQIRGAKLKGERTGEIIGAFVVFSDVTRIRHLENVRSDFVSNVSHEIKTPLTSIKGFVETLLDESEGLTEEGKSYLEIIRKQADRLDEIVDDLLTLSRLEQDIENNRIVMEEQVLARVVVSAADVCRGKWGGKRDFVMDVKCPEEIRYPMNARLMEQVFTNLIDNAVKYGKEGGQIRIEAGVLDQHVNISVGDNGAGIPREHLERLFERFYRVDVARGRDQGGSGLGLAIVKHIVQAHSGEIHVESELGRGTTFFLKFPMRHLSRGDAKTG